MRSRCVLLLIVMSLVSTAAVSALGRSVCDYDPFKREIETDGQKGMLLITPGPGTSALALHQVRIGACTSFLVMLGMITDITDVTAVDDGHYADHTLLTIAPATTWKAHVEGPQCVRLMDDLDSPARGRPAYPPLEVGDTCLLFADPDSLGELVAPPISFVFRDSVTLGHRGQRYDVTQGHVIALVESCVVERGVPWIVGHSDLIVEGIVDSYVEDWDSMNRTASEVSLSVLAIHKGDVPGDQFQLVNVRGHDGWGAWPTFAPGDTVLLFLEDDPAIGHSLLGGWQGKWTSVGADSFRIGENRRWARHGFVSPSSEDRASPAPRRMVTRLELEAALAGAGHVPPDE
ncbi:MAG: hypothetical protein JXA57_13805 [Armatimonadetes bacterium]|nr:hypothetical protein [Armatimonadota bacterium]